jgi:hypothetical protein
MTPAWPPLARARKRVGEAKPAAPAARAFLRNHFWWILLFSERLHVFREFRLFLADGLGALSLSASLALLQTALFPFLLEGLDATALHEFEVIRRYVLAQFSDPGRIAQFVAIVEIIAMFLHLSVEVNHQITDDLGDSVAEVIS